MHLACAGALPQWHPPSLCGLRVAWDQVKCHGGNGSNVAATALATCSAAAMATKHHQLKNKCSAADASLQAFCCRQWKPAALAVVTGKAWALQRCNTQEQKLGGGVTVLEVRTPGCSITRCPSARCSRLASLSGQRQRHGHLFGSCCPTHSAPTAGLGASLTGTASAPVATVTSASASGWLTGLGGLVSVRTAALELPGHRDNVWRGRL